MIETILEIKYKRWIIKVFLNKNFQKDVILALK